MQQISFILFPAGCHLTGKNINEMNEKNHKKRASVYYVNILGHVKCAFRPDSCC